MLRFDEDMAKAFYLIEYKDWYDKDFHGGEEELRIDKCLSYLSYICYLLKTGNLAKEERKFLEYVLFRACKSQSVQAYLWNLYCFSETQNTKPSFQYLIDYGVEFELFSKSDFNKDCPKYLSQKYLNF